MRAPRPWFWLREVASSKTSCRVSPVPNWGCCFMGLTWLIVAGRGCDSESDQIRSDRGKKNRIPFERV